jgi:hypothetical protein
MSEHRYTLQDAASELGITPDALRQRIRRGQYRSEKDGSRVYVYLDTDRTQTEQEMLLESNVLTSQLMDRVAFLERELEVRTEEIRRRDTIIMNMTEAMKVLPPPTQEEPSEARESPVRPPKDADRGAQEPTQERKPWWRWFFGD